MKKPNVSFAAICIFILSGCLKHGASGSKSNTTHPGSQSTAAGAPSVATNSSSSPSTTTTASDPNYTLAVQVSGLNESQNLGVSFEADLNNVVSIKGEKSGSVNQVIGTFPANEPFTVNFTSMPLPLNCTAAPSRGTLSQNTTIQIACSTVSYTLSGTIALPVSLPSNTVTVTLNGTPQSFTSGKTKGNLTWQAQSETSVYLYANYLLASDSNATANALRSQLEQLLQNLVITTLLGSTPFYNTYINFTTGSNPNQLSLIDGLPTTGKIVSVTAEGKALTGTLPPSLLGQLSGLVSLTLNNNQFSGTDTDIQNLMNQLNLKNFQQLGISPQSPVAPATFSTAGTYCQQVTSVNSSALCN